MPRFSSVQAYADNNANVRSISYAEATGQQQQGKASGEGNGPAGTGTGGVKTEKVSNPYGSTAGAGSGEFHVYRHARAREAMRWEQLDKAEASEKQEIEYQNLLKANELEQERKLSKNRKKRQRSKAAKLKKKSLKAAGINLDISSAQQQDANAPTDGGDEDEFAYVPISQQEQPSKQEVDTTTKKSQKEIVEGRGPKNQRQGDETINIPNDGSFLEAFLAQTATPAQSGHKRQSNKEEGNGSGSSGRNKNEKDDDECSPHKKQKVKGD